MTTSPEVARTMVGGPRQFTRASALVVTAVILAACTSAEPPSELPVPEVTWPDSAMAYGLEDSRWVQAVREAEVLSSVAWNSLDYSDRDLIAAWGYDTVLEVLYDEAQLRFVPDVYDLPQPAVSVLDWGPNPLVILAVTDQGDSAVVKTCAVDGRTITGDVWNVVVREYHVRDVGDGRTEISFEDQSGAPSQAGLDECAPDEMPRPVFEPAPVFPTSSDVTLRPPADRSVYDES